MALVTRTYPMTLLGATDEETEILREYAEFWKIPYSRVSKFHEEHAFVSADAFLSGPADDKPVTIVPSKTSAQRIAERFQLNLNTVQAHLSLPAAPDAEVAINTEVFRFGGPRLEPVLRSSDFPILSRINGSKTYLLSIDLIGEYSARVYHGFEENPSWKFRLAAKLPFSYQAVPKFVRDRAFRASKSLDQLSKENLGPVEFLRTLFLASLVLSRGPIPRVRFWKPEKSHAFIVTHDVETANGLSTGAGRLLRVEQELGLRSTWNIPSDRYPISIDSLRGLNGSAELGGHDTRHDGRLIFLNREEKVRRLAECRDRLEQLSEKQVRGFRAPLLQHSADLASAEASAGYEYDSSCPSYEILSPTSMRPHGVGTLFPIEMKGILEIPVSLPQDHQLIRVAGLTPAEAVDLLLSLSAWITRVGGPSVLLVHPDYELAQEQNLHEYKRLLEGFASDPKCQLMTLGEFNDWWRQRRDAHWEIMDEHTILLSAKGQRERSTLEAELVTGYGANGFTTEALS